MAFPAPVWNGVDIDVNHLPNHWIITPDGSRALNLNEMENNACMFTMYWALSDFTDTFIPNNGGKIHGLGNKFSETRNWTPQAVAGMLGNITIESTINPSRWQNDTPPPDPETGTEETGYGLVQWTPYSKYRNWVLHDGDGDGQGYLAELWGTWQNNGYLETERISAERDHEIQWIKTDKFNYSFKDFGKKEDDPSILAEAFLRNYERPADPDSTLKDRQEWAEYWFYRVTRPIYGYVIPWWHWKFSYVYMKKYMGRWYL
jgi:hypothetical protein